MGFEAHLLGIGGTRAEDLSMPAPCGLLLEHEPERKRSCAREGVGAGDGVEWNWLWG